MTTRRKIAQFACAFALLLSAVAQQTRHSIPSSEYQIAGTVVDLVSTRPIAGANVLIAYVENRNAIRTVRTDASGRFAFPALASGKYSLNADFHGYPPQGYEQHENFSTAIVVGPGLDAAHLVFRLQPEATIRGRVVDEENDPVSDAFVRLFANRVANGSLTTQVVQIVASDDRGSFVFSHLRGGDYYLAVSGQPWYGQTDVNGGIVKLRSQVTTVDSKDASDKVESPEAAPGMSPEASVEKEARAIDKAFPVTFFGDTTDSARAAPVHLQPGETATADVSVRALQGVHLQIPTVQQPSDVDASVVGVGGSQKQGRMFNPPQIQLFQRVFDGTLIPVNANAAGSVENWEYNGFAPGHYLLQTSTRALGPPSKNADESGSYLELDIPGDMDLPTGASPTATLDGVARFDSPAAPSSLAIVLNDRALARAHVSRLAATGEFESKELLIPGKYEVSVNNAQGWYIKSASAVGAKISGRMLHINGGETVRLTLNISKGLAEVKGTAFREGKPHSGAMIILVPRNAENSTVLFRRDQSDSDGTFTLADVVPGTYTLLAIEDGWKLAWSDPAVLQQYLAKGETLHVAASAKLRSTVRVQDR